jgi:DNA sulfur modification protein DndE
LDNTGDSSVEMSWDVFSGGTGRLYWEVLIQWAVERGLDPESEDLESLFRRHVHRGIAALAGRPEYNSLENLLQSVALGSDAIRGSAGV